TECPSDPTIPIDDPECTTNDDMPVFSSSSSATSTQQSFDAKFIKEQLRLRESEEKGGGAGDDLLDKRFSAILATDFTSLDQDTVEKAIGFDSDRTGVFIGLDYRVNDNFWFGTSIDYAREDAQFDQNLRSQDINEYGLSVYSFYDYDKAHVSLLARYADQDYDIEVEEPVFIKDMTSG
ncbi:Autotransporter beta-domain protein domain protein, partial [Candidatus Thiomargarita nelsonii]